MKTVKIPLSKGLFAVIDEADLPIVSKFKWHAHKARNTWYARTDRVVNGKRRNIYLHSLLSGGSQTDHRDTNGLNNRRSNLRACTQSQNSANMPTKRDGFRGVSWDKSRGKWIAGLTVNYQRINAGRFATEEEAALAYDDLAIQHFGKFARLNFPNLPART